MSSVLNRHKSLDYLVLDYLRRNCEYLVSEGFQIDRKLADIDPPATTLEVLYSSKLKAETQPQIERDDIGMEAVFSLAYRPIFAQRPMPNLPELVIENVLSFLPANNIFLLRFLNREWNRCASRSLRSKNRTAVTFNESSRMKQFFQIFEKRPQNWINPFTAYRFHDDRVDIVPLLRLIGRDVKIGKFEYVAPSSYSQMHLTFLNFTPNIQKLSFYGDTNIEPCQGLRLPNLKTLSLCKVVSPQRSMTPLESFEFYRSSETCLSFEHLKIWMKIAPALQELRLYSTVSVNCEFEFARFIVSRGLRHLTLSGLILQSQGPAAGLEPIKNCALSNHELTLEFKYKHIGRMNTRDTAAVSNFVAYLSDSITRCSVNFENDTIVLPDLRHCNYLKVWLWRGVSLQPITASGFSNLRTVTLERFDINADTHHHFAGDRFPSVETLQLILPVEAGFTRQDWHVTFPRVTCLRVAALFQPDLVRCIWKHFAHVSRLHLCYTGEKFTGLPGLVDTTRKMNQFDSETAQQGSFFKFENLLQLDLEIEDAWDEGNSPRLWTQNIAPLLKRVIALTAAKLIQPLQDLTVFCTCHSNLITQEAGLFLALRELNWHKNVDLICQPKASYHKW